MENNKEEFILINAANLHKGGAVQVATSFVFELLSREVLPPGLSIWVSSEVESSLALLGVDVSEHIFIEVVDVFGIRAWFSDLNDRLSGFDLVFTIFGPNYFRNTSYINVVGFAQMWVLDDSAYLILPFWGRLKFKLKFLAQGFFFRRADAFVVELEHVRDRLLNKGFSSPDLVYVAHNCISSIYLNPASWHELECGIDSCSFKVGFLGRDYPHKNTAILPEIKEILFNKYGLHVDFYVTFDDSEWARKDNTFKSAVLNVGSLAVNQCPFFYKALDAVIFPSLLECFSATPLEAMAMQKPVFASDRQFVKDVCFDHVFYFDPLCPESAADVISNYILTRHGKDESRLDAGREHALGFSSAEGRAERYLEVIQSELMKSLTD